MRSTPTRPDLLYVLGTGSVWQDNELRYSLRSAQECVPHGRVVLAGARPEWVRNATHVPVQDMHDRNRVLNTLGKLHAACEARAVGEHFLLMNDDFLFLDRVEEHVAFHQGRMRDTARRRRHATYAVPFEHARALLMRAGISLPWDHELHMPLPMRRSKVLELVERFGLGTQPYAWRTLYANLYCTERKACADVKLYTWPGDADGTYLSYDDPVAADERFRAWCAARWPAPSVYER